MVELELNLITVSFLETELTDSRPRVLDPRLR
jgi:hypothetical protein